MSEARKVAVAAIAGRIALGVGLIGATYIAASAWERVKTRPRDRTIEVTGSARKRIVSDLIEWTGAIETQHPTDRTAAYRTLRAHVEATRAYLVAQGIKEDEIFPSSVDVAPIYETEVDGNGADRVEKQVFKGYRTRQAISVRSNDVKRVERVSREVTQLLEQGVPVTSSAPRYFYTKLGELKIAMLAEAAHDARTRAENMVGAAGGAALSRLREADMGVINVNAANSTSTSWEGNNDTTSLDKDVITIVHVTYELR
jgi:hypothetical protein